MRLPLVLEMADSDVTDTIKYPIKAEKVEISDSMWTKFITHVDTALASDAAQGS